MIRGLDIGAMNIAPDQKRILLALLAEVGSGDALAPSGMVKIASAAVTEPVSYIDFALPAGYSEFNLVVTAANTSPAGGIAMAFSADGGLSFDDDTTHYDTYEYIFENAHGNVNESIVLSNGDFTDSPIPVAAYLYGLGYSVVESVSCRSTIFPGSATAFPTVDSRLTAVLHNDADPTLVQVQYESNFSSYNLAATVPPAIGRRNWVRLRPYSGTITAGTFSLFGLTN